MMTELDGPENLVSYFSDELFLKSVGIPLQIIQNCVIHELKHEIQFFLPTKIFDEIHQIFVT